MTALVVTNLAWAALAAFFLHQHARERAAQRSREDELLNRIQAPALAVSQSLGEQPDTGELAYVPFDDDDALNEYMDSFS